MNNLKECRICFNNDKDDEYIAPCLCSGTSKYVHISCLEKWREINKYKAVQATFKRAEYFVNIAYDALGIFNYSEEKKVLQNLTEFSMNRSY